MLGSLLALATALTAGPGPADPTDPPKDGVELVAQMREQYLGKWYRTLTFVQKTTLADGKVETWYEAAELPGKLRIDIAPLDAKNTLLFRNDTLYEFKAGKLAESKLLVHPLMVLGFDVYAQPVDKTVRQLRALGFDLSRLHEAEWQGRPAWVVGAAAGDTVTRQFWIDQERLYFVRMVEPGKQNPSASVETQFNKYIPMGQGWLETEVRFLVNGETKMLEEYTEPKAGVTLNPAIFDPATWIPPGWVR
ncbi:MAG TPA: hypothetical protein VG500_06375 [Gemmatimonadales bacterium]|nr:hypothetical protein [Gemmatimonadales bacterium]